MEKMVDTKKLHQSLLEVSKRVYDTQTPCSYELNNLPMRHSYLKEAEILCRTHGIKLKVITSEKETVHVSVNLKAKKPIIVVKKPKSKKQTVNDEVGKLAIQAFGTYSNYIDKNKNIDYEIANQEIENRIMTYGSVYFKGWKLGHKYIKKSDVIG